MQGRNPAYLLLLTSRAWPQQARACSLLWPTGAAHSVGSARGPAPGGRCPCPAASGARLPRRPAATTAAAADLTTWTWRSSASHWVRQQNALLLLVRAAQQWVGQWAGRAVAEACQQPRAGAALTPAPCLSCCAPGIPGFDDALIPRVVGAVGGLLLLVNHLLSESAPTDAQVGGGRLAAAWGLSSARAAAHSALQPAAPSMRAVAPGVELGLGLERRFAALAPRRQAARREQPRRPCLLP